MVDVVIMDKGLRFKTVSARVVRLLDDNKIEVETSLNSASPKYEIELARVLGILSFRIEFGTDLWFKLNQNLERVEAGLNELFLEQYFHFFFMVGSATWYSSECDLPYMTGPVRNRI
ncbi:MAG TPA: hypothetical protein VGQ13_04965 [Nitrososphaera sp.]|nr:hypothetical protein [Nitrososphaera sp.]